MDNINITYIIPNEILENILHHVQTEDLYTCYKVSRCFNHESKIIIKRRSNKILNRLFFFNNEDIDNKISYLWLLQNDYLILHTLEILDKENRKINPRLEILYIFYIEKRYIKDIQSRMANISNKINQLKSDIETFDKILN